MFYNKLIFSNLMKHSFKPFTNLNSNTYNPFLNKNNFKVNVFNGVEFDLSKWNKNDLLLFESIYTFEDLNELLTNYLTSIENSNYVSIGITIPGNLGKIIGPLQNKNYYLHHTTEKNIVLCKWLDKSKPNKIPNFPYTQIGVAGAIISKEKGFLLIKERIREGRKVQWKFVTGLIDFPETIKEGTLREINEETGITEDKLEFIGNLYTRWMGPWRNILDCCFFNVLLLKEDIDIKVLKNSLCKQELSDINYFSIKEVKELINTDDVTKVTKAIISRMLLEYEEDKDFDNYLNNIRNRVNREVDINHKKEINLFKYAMTSLKEPKF
jgi:8-oxo-dGTP pyrophosphatase MutT (NUDIX family)